MSQIQINNIRAFIIKKSSSLMKSEGKTFAKIAFDESHFSQIIYNNRKFVIISTNVFSKILESVLTVACTKYPENFGTGDFNKVLEAIYNIEKFGDMDHFCDFLKTEQFAWILEAIDNTVNKNVLRVELFRTVKPTKEDTSKTEFVGGAFHLFKHFTYKGIPLSTKKENTAISHPSSLLELLIDGFYFNELIQKTESKYKSTMICSTTSVLDYAFYRNIDADVYFINSIIYKSKNNGRYKKSIG